MSESPIDAHLDRLFDRLAGTGAAGRRALAEAEDHLRSAAAQAVTEGADPVEAERIAVARFGDAADIATRLRRVHLSTADVLRRSVTGAWLLGAVGLLAVGVSGLLAEVAGRLFGAHLVAGDGPGVTYTAQRCAEYLRLVPGAPTCARAAELHHWGEVVEYRVAAGVLGLVALALYAAARRIGPLRDPAWRPPAGPLALVAIAVFGLAATVLTLPDLARAAAGDLGGSGADLTAGVVAAVVAAAAAVVGLRRLRYAG
ncbi:permease prefix domain 1-containing protein [Micromonospora sp. NPDC005806]|uniref:permease prefix domain 1-containing protein n=1 Tax=Micromonospora sp. NPDC005806 TaxID=3364234 RepID=UPI00369D37EE